MDQTHLDRLRSLAALVHCSPGATLHLECNNGSVVVAGTHAGADLSPCQLRKALSASFHPAGSDIVDHIRAMSVGGTLEPAGPGLFDDRRGPIPTKRVVSLLEPTLVEDALNSIVMEEAESAHLSAHLGADALLGVTTVEISRSDEDPAELLEAMATAAAAAIMVRECEALPEAGFAPSGIRRPTDG